MPTLKEIALRLNLSVMAVSKALRDAPDISAATKTRVLAEARRLHYVPNRAAQNLRLRRTGLLGVVVPNVNHTDYSNYVWGLERAAESAGLQLILAHSLDRAETEILEVKKLIARQVEGIVLIPAVRWQHRLATLELLRPSKIPTVLLSAYPAGAEHFPGLSWVVSQDEAGGQLATDHLLDLGHREILFLAGPNGSSSSAGRFSGYQRALAARGLVYRHDRVYLAGSHIESGTKAMNHALSEKTGFTAVVAYNDSVALGAISALQQQGFQVPEEVSVVGFGDGLLAHYFRVPLTTIHVPQVEMGEAAFRLWLDLRAEKPVEPRRLPVSLTVRKSTRALAAA